MLIAWLYNVTLVFIVSFTEAFLLILLLFDQKLFNFLVCFQTGASLQQKADGWKEKVNETRGSRPRTPTHLDQEVQVTIYLV